MKFLVVMMLQDSIFPFGLILGTVQVIISWKTSW